MLSHMNISLGLLSISYLHGYALTKNHPTLGFVIVPTLGILLGFYLLQILQGPVRSIHNLVPG